MTLQEAVEKTAGGPVHETGWFGVWERATGDGAVAVTLFETDTDPKKLIYGWTVKSRDGDGSEHVTVLRQGEVDSPVAAVLAWVDSQSEDPTI